MGRLRSRLARVSPFYESDPRFFALRRFSRRLLLGLACWILCAWTWERGLLQSLPPWLWWGEHALDLAALASLLLGAVVRFLPPTRRFRRYSGGLEALLATVSVVEWSCGGDHRLPLLAGQIVHLGSSTGGRLLRERLIDRLQAGAARLAPLSFALVIMAGTVVLCLPVATRDGSATSLVDALFTATSATCVTGLIVKDTPTYFSSFGHWTILGLIQIGGLGTMTLSLSLIALFRPPSGRQREALKQVMSVAGRNDVYVMVRFVALTTVAFELVGLLLLLLFPGPDSPSGAGKVFVGLFHAVSAFCNAGFSLWSDSLTRAPPGAVLTVSALIIVGGLGFTILKDLHDAFLPRGLFGRKAAVSRDGPGETVIRRRVRGVKGLSLHTRLGLVATAVLISAGTVLMFYGEYDNTMREFTFGEKLLHAYFQSVTTRTAGFNTLPLADFAPALLFAACILMFIGACPGGTGGGIKTTTTAALLLSLRSLISPRGRLEAFGRSLPDVLFQRAVAIALAALGTFCLGVFLLLVVEARPAIELLFEAASALGTVGLSTGVTPNLSVEGKLIIVGLMFAGRVGPLTLALTVGERGRAWRHRYPMGEVLVG